jgi:hypothetical protein
VETRDLTKPAQAEAYATKAENAARKGRRYIGKALQRAWMSG